MDWIDKGSTQPAFTMAVYRVVTPGFGPRNNGLSLGLKLSCSNWLQHLAD
mgnify:CR=1 FL=1